MEKDIYTFRSKAGDLITYHNKKKINEFVSLQ